MAQPALGAHRRDRRGAEAEDDEPGEAAADAGALFDRARALVAPPDGETPFGRRYLVMLQLHPGIVMAHSALVKELAASPHS